MKQVLQIKVIQNESEIPADLEGGPWYVPADYIMYFKGSNGNRETWSMPIEGTEWLRTEDTSPDVVKQGQPSSNEFILDLVATALNPSAYFGQKK